MAAKDALSAAAEGRERRRSFDPSAALYRCRLEMSVFQPKVKRAIRAIVRKSSRRPNRPE